MGKRNPIKMIEVYSEHSTVSGLVYIFMKDQRVVGRIFWSVTVIFLISTGIYWSKISYDDWKSRPVVTTVSSTGFPISEIPFPAVTFCTQGKILKNLFASLIRQYFEFTNENVTKILGMNLTFIEIATFQEAAMALMAQTKFDSNLESTFNKFLTKKWSSFINASFPGTPDILEVGINDLIQYIGAQLSGVPDFIMRQVAIYKLIYKSPSHSALEWMLNPELAKAVDSETDLSTSLAKYFFDAIDKKKSLAAYFKTMWYSLLPCFDVRGMTSVNGSESAMLTYCMWKNLPVSCAAIFSTFPTDSGMCCVFNMVKAENLFLESEYTRLINEMQSKDKKLALQNTTMPLWSKKSLMGIEGKGLGLITILDSHSDLVGPMTVYDNTLGFTALVDSRDSFPFIKTKGIPIQPGHFNQIVLSAVEIDAADEIRHLAPRSRNCLFSDETSHLRFHKIYTQTNCVLECRIIAAQKEVKERFNMSTVCTPWYLPFNEGTFCDPWQGKVFQETMSDGTESPGCLKQCLPDCKRTVYDPKVMTQKITGCDEHNLGLTGLCNLMNLSELPRPHIFGQQVLDEFQIHLKKNPSYLKSIHSSLRTKSGFYFGGTFHLINRSYDAYEKDIAIVQVYFDTPTAVKFLTEPRLSWIDYISNVGGLLGLCVGLNIVTIIEIAWLIMRVGNSFLHRNR